MDNNNFLKSLSRGLLDDVRKVMEGKTHTVPKTEKEKKLAALAEPKDKITHADVLKGRGVVKEEEQIDELSTSTLRKYREKARDDAFDADAVDDDRRLRKRSFGHNQAGKKIIKRGDALRAEEVELDESAKVAAHLIKRYGENVRKSHVRSAANDFGVGYVALSHAVRKKLGVNRLEEEQIDELSKKTLASYIGKAATSAANKASEFGRKSAERDEVDRMTNRHMSFDDKDKIHKAMKTTHRDVEEPREKVGKRVHGIKRATARLAKEEVQIDEALDAAARYGQHHTAVKELMKSISQHIENHKSDALKHRDYRGKKGVNWGHVGDIAHIHSQLADIHDRLAQQGEYKKEMAESVEDDFDVEFTAEELAFLEDCGIDLEEARRGRPPKNAAAAQDEEPAALGYQLRKAASINKPVHFMNGEKKEVSSAHIEKFNDHMAARKSSQDKADFQKQAHKSHADFVKAVSSPLPKSSRDTGEIVKYRH